jgi:hypothetical protein
MDNISWNLVRLAFGMFILRFIRLGIVLLVRTFARAFTSRLRYLMENAKKTCELPIINQTQLPSTYEFLSKSGSGNFDEKSRATQD